MRVGKQRQTRHDSSPINDKWQIKVILDQQGNKKAPS